jgi:hypothetical protein
MPAAIEATAVFKIILNAIVGVSKLTKPPVVTADKVRERPPLLKFAFANPYNLSLLTGALAASALTLNPFIAVAALGAEALWLLHAPESRALRRLVWDKKLDKLCAELDEQALEAKIATLEQGDQRRVRELIAEEQKIDQLAAQNPSFSGDLMRDELVKSAALVSAYVDMIVNCSRYEHYLASIDPKQLERDQQMWEKRLQSPKQDPRTTDIAKKNIEIISKRIEKMTEIREYITVARGQLELIENTFHLIADQIVTMQSPREMSGQLDQLLSGVEAVRSAAIYTDGLSA